MDKYEVQKEFNEVCFSLNNLEGKLTQIAVETFVLNPEIRELTQQIQTLRNKKEELKNYLTKEATDGE